MDLVELPYSLVTPKGVSIEGAAAKPQVLDLDGLLKIAPPKSAFTVIVASKPGR
jgi:hypothetical protein